MIRYRPGLAPPPFGLPNIGATCYFNSFIQALVGLPAVSQFFLEHEKELSGNAVAVAYIDLLRSVLGRASPVESANPIGMANPVGLANPTALFRAFVLAIRAKNPRSTFGSGQEDADEALTLFLDTIDHPELYKLFMTTYNLSVFCFGCRVMSPIRSDNSCVVEMTPGDLTPIEEKIRQYIVPCPGYKCPKCGKGDTPPPQTLYRLSNVGSIITILFRKYAFVAAPAYPQTIELPANGGGKHTFSLVAIIEHAGSPAGGHYWARCLRAKPPHHLAFSRIDDSHVSEADSLPRPESYVLFYHCF